MLALFCRNCKGTGVIRKNVLGFYFARFRKRCRHCMGNGVTELTCSEGTKLVVTDDDGTKYEVKKVNAKSQ